MIDLNNNNNNINNFNPNSNVDPNSIHNGIIENKTSIALVVGIIVLIGAILIVGKLGVEVVNKFNKLKTKAETMFPGGLEEAFGDMLEDGEFDAGKEYFDPEDKPVDFNPYAKYKDIVWCDTKDEYKGMEVYIENGAVYSKNGGEDTKIKWTTIGTPIKLHLAPPSAEAYVLTKEGKVYSVCYESCTQELKLDQYTIIDMAYLNNYTHEKFYFLTSDGELIDVNGVPYDKYGFVGIVDFDKMLYIPIDKDGHAYFYDNENDTYLPLIDKNNSKLKIAKIYSIRGYALIQTVYGKWYKYEGISAIPEIESEKFVSRIERKESAEQDVLVLYFMDGTTKKYNDLLGVYDVASNREIELDELNMIVEPLINTPSNIEEISSALKQQMMNLYDAKTLTGAEVIATFQQYANSDISIVIITKVYGNAYTGKYKIDGNKLKEENSNTSRVMRTKPYEGGVFYLEQPVKFDSKIKRTEFTKLYTELNMNAAQTYYSSIIKDSTGNAFGIVFIEK